MAEAMADLFVEVVIAPDYTEEALVKYRRKANLRILRAAATPETTLSLRTIQGGLLAQIPDVQIEPAASWQVVTQRQPTADELDGLDFAWRVAKHVKSNAIVYVRDGATVGIGAGQMSRVDSTRIAARKSLDMAEALGLPRALTHGSVVASDAFFPFADGLLAAAEAGATAVIQPGGSMNDAEVIAAADAAGLAMVFTAMRHFCRNSSRTALISVPAWPIPTHQTKLVMSHAQSTVLFKPQTPMPLLNR